MKTKTIIVNGKKFNLKAVAAGMVQKPKTVHKPSANLVRLKNIIAKMLAKKPIPKATAIAPIVKAPAKAPERSNLFRRYLATMAVDAKELTAITQGNLKELSDDELKLLKIKIDNAIKVRIYDKTSKVEQNR
ncbi:hypothetical protein [Flavobacterium sp. WC2416]|uniref:Uncharacterized protein n=1 Tax=Flavobacterium sp. WC2416 TaxID=3234141 RepID=A0AB39W958_9FLAO